MEHGVALSGWRACAFQPGYQLEQEADAVLPGAWLLVQEVPERVVLQGLFELIPFVGDAQLLGCFARGVVGVALEKQRTDQLVVGQGILPMFRRVKASTGFSLAASSYQMTLVRLSRVDLKSSTSLSC